MSNKEKKFNNISNQGAPVRADMLKEHWMFVCQCHRCLDPTDCGTYASAIRCPKCKLTGDPSSGFLLPFGKSGDNLIKNYLSILLGKNEDKNIVLETNARELSYHLGAPLI